MVRDILIDTNERDLIFTDNQAQSRVSFDTMWTEDGRATYPICNILIPREYWESVIFQDNEFVCCFKSHYIPKYSLFNVRLVKLLDDGQTIEPFQETGIYGILAYTFAFDQKIANPIYASQLPYVDIDGDFLVKFVIHTDEVGANAAYIYSSKQTDLLIGYSDNQAGKLLSLCNPGNHYRFPLLGVGVEKYINTVIAHSDFVDNINKQFGDDNRTVYSVDFDNQTGECHVSFSKETEIEDEGLLPVDELDLLDEFDDEYIREHVLDKMYNCWIGTGNSVQSVIGNDVYLHKIQGITSLKGSYSMHCNENARNIIIIVPAFFNLNPATVIFEHGFYLAADSSVVPYNGVDYFVLVSNQLETGRYTITFTQRN